MDHIKNARNYRTLSDASHTANGINPLCGDELNVYLRVVESRIEDAAFQCTCCGISMASASIMTEAIKGKDIGEARAFGKACRALLETPAPEASDDSPLRAVVETIRQLPGRVRCATLPWTTLEAALASAAGRES